MKVQFTSHQQISYDGYHVTSYHSGNVYESSHMKESKYFQSAVESGLAEPWMEKQVERAHPATKADRKVLTPKNTK
jgi:hypothetical protein